MRPMISLENISYHIFPPSKSFLPCTYLSLSLPLTLIPPSPSLSPPLNPFPPFPPPLPPFLPSLLPSLPLSTPSFRLPRRLSRTLVLLMKTQLILSLQRPRLCRIKPRRTEMLQSQTDSRWQVRCIQLPLKHLHDTGQMCGGLLKACLHCGKMNPDPSGSYLDRLYLDRMWFGCVHTAITDKNILTSKHHVQPRVLKLPSACQRSVN